MSIQPVSALVAAIVSFAIGGSVLLREPRRRAHVLFATRRVREGYRRFHSRPHSVIYPTCVEPERLLCDDRRQKNAQWSLGLRT